MKTQRTIGMILCAAILGALLVLVGAWALAGAIGFVTAVGFGAVAVAAYVLDIGPRLDRWGASAAEVSEPMPGDDIVRRAAATTTRGVTVHTAPAAVWPWIAQIGFGRAGWYSYDWIDNDGQPSATSIVDELQHLAVGDVVAMTPTMGFTVHSVDPGHGFVAIAPDGTTWSLELRPTPDGSATRLLSRYRTVAAPGIAGRLWMAIARPGSFVMERKMLLGIRRRAERADHPAAEVAR